MPTDVLEKAAGWLVKLLCADRLSGVLPGLNAWLREDESHWLAFEEAQRAWRLAKPFLQVAQPGAGAAEVEAFFEALERERGRSVGELADS